MRCLIWGSAPSTVRRKAPQLASGPVGSLEQLLFFLPCRFGRKQSEDLQLFVTGNINPSVGNGRDLVGVALEIGPLARYPNKNLVQFALKIGSESIECYGWLSRGNRPRQSPNNVIRVLVRRHASEKTVVLTGGDRRRRDRL